jgi:hypothetical protein
MTFFAILLVIYVAIAYLAKGRRERGKPTLQKWIHEDYLEDFKDASIPEAQTLIDKWEEIPSDTPTLFIIGGLRSQSRAIRFFDYFTELLSLGWVRFDSIVPEGYPVDLVLCFENIFKRSDPRGAGIGLTPGRG